MRRKEETGWQDGKEDVIDMSDLSYFAILFRRTGSDHWYILYKSHAEEAPTRKTVGNIFQVHSD